MHAGSSLYCLFACVGVALAAATPPEGVRVDDDNAEEEDASDRGRIVGMGRHVHPVRRLSRVELLFKKKRFTVFPLWGGFLGLVECATQGWLNAPTHAG